jgi:hypothetical protein
MPETRRNKHIRNDGKTRKTVRHFNDNYNLNLSNYDDYFLSADDLVGKKFTRLKNWSTDHLRLIDYWIPIQIHITEGLRHLHINFKHHGRLGVETIVADISGNIRIIDCGLNSDGLIYKPEQNSRAPEMDIVAGLKNGLLGSELLDDIFEKKRFLQTVDNLFYNWSMDSFLNSIDIQTDGDVEKFMKLYLRCSDIWSLGVLLLIIYMDFIADPVVSGSNFYRNNHRNQMKIFEGMLNPDPRKRYTVDMVLNELYSMRMDCV